MHTILKYIYLKHTIVYSDNKINNCNNTIKGTGNILVFFSAIIIIILYIIYNYIAVSSFGPPIGCDDLKVPCYATLNRLT